MIVNTKIISGLYITNLFIGFFISVIVIIVFGTYFSISLYVDSYQNNHRGSKYISKLFWYLVLDNKKVDKADLIRKAGLIKQNNDWYNNENLSGILNDHTNKVFALMTDFFNNSDEIRRGNNPENNVNINENNQNEDNRRNESEAHTQ